MFDDDKTQVLTEGTEDYPLDATLAATPEPCQNCQTEIATASQFCSKCGYQRGTWGESDSQDDMQSGEESEPATALYFLVNNDERVGIPDGETIVGRGNVDIKLNDGYLSRKHARFNASVDALEVTDLGSANGSFLDDEKLGADEPVALVAGQALKLGQTSYAIEKAEPPVVEKEIEPTETTEQTDALTNSANTDETPQSELSHIEMFSWCLEYGDGEIIPLKIGDTTLGRSASKSDVGLTGDGFMSSLHIRISTRSDNVQVEDLGSTNGTKLNDDSLEANTPATLYPGDSLQVGETKFILSQKEPPAQAKEDQVENDDPSEVNNSSGSEI